MIPPFDTMIKNPNKKNKEIKSSQSQGKFYYRLISTNKCLFVCLNIVEVYMIAMYLSLQDLLVLQWVVKQMR